MSWWIVSVADRNDELLRDRRYMNGRRYISIWKLPERARYTVQDTRDTKAGTNAVQRALEMAAADGIASPVCLGHSRTRYRIVNGRVVDL